MAGIHFIVRILKGVLIGARANQIEEWTKPLDHAVGASFFVKTADALHPPLLCMHAQTTHPAAAIRCNCAKLLLLLLLLGFHQEAARRAHRAVHAQDRRQHSRQHGSTPLTPLPSSILS
jgi:hypothetical protein